MRKMCSLTQSSISLLFFPLKQLAIPYLSVASLTLLFTSPSGIGLPFPLKSSHKLIPIHLSELSALSLFTFAFRVY